jgi:hypothetical protein
MFLTRLRHLTARRFGIRPHEIDVTNGVTGPELSPEDPVA